MTRKELEVAAEMLRLAADQFSHHGCNDWQFPDHWTQEECDKVTLAMAVASGDPESHEPGRRDAMDWWVMDYLAGRLDAIAAEVSE